MAELKNVQLPAELHAQLVARQQKTGVPITRQVADAIREMLKKAKRAA